MPVLVLACLAALGGCADSSAAERAAPLPPPGSFAISYERGGGFAPSTSKLVVTRGRHALAVASAPQGGERRVGFRIGKRRVLSLERGLRKADFGSIESPGPSGCADCFAYEIRYRGHSVSLDESQMPARLGKVVAELESVVTAHAIPPKA